jgi:hypothetical protein
MDMNRWYKIHQLAMRCHSLVGGDRRTQHQGEKGACCSIVPNADQSYMEATRSDASLLVPLR